MRQAKGSRSTNGFTLIELMIVIGIIMLLMSIVAFGFRHVQARAARHETIAEMHICEGMVYEYGAVNGLTNIEQPTGTIAGPLIPLPDGVTKVPTPVFYDTLDGSSATGPQPSYLTSDNLAGDSLGDYSTRSPGDPRYTSPIVKSTQAVMFILLKDSHNRAMLSVIPAKRILEQPSTSTAMNYGDYSVILDGWGNPIIYVPKGGMLTWGMVGSQSSNFMVRSSGTYISDANGGGGMLPKVGVNDRPFFASAGQDGIFTDPQRKTDNAVDNVYSFQK